MENYLSIAAQYASISMDYIRGAGNAIARNAGKIAFTGIAALVILSIGGCPDGNGSNSSPRKVVGSLGSNAGFNRYPEADKDRGEKPAVDPKVRFCYNGCPYNK